MQRGKGLGMLVAALCAWTLLSSCAPRESQAEPAASGGEPAGKPAAAGLAAPAADAADVVDATEVANAAEAPASEEDADVAERAIPSAGVPSPGKDDIAWTSAELARIATLRKTGLRIATTESLAIYEPRQGAEPEGVQYRLARAMAEKLGARLQTRVVQFADYFAWKGGLPPEVKTDPGMRYVPDLFRAGVDLYVDTITVLPWRERILAFIPVMPTRLVALTRKGEELKDKADLAGKRISIIPGTASEDALLALRRDLGTAFDIIPVGEVQDEARLVAEGASDVTVQDANVAILHLRAWKNLAISLNLSEAQQLAWACSPEDPDLASLVRKYLSWSQETGILNAIWEAYYGIPLVDYMWLLAD